MPFGKLLKACGKIALVTLSTTSSAATLPTTINVSMEDLGAPEGISKFTLPLGCTINMCGGACSFCCLAVFVSDFYDIGLSFGTIVFLVFVATLINMAAPGIPGGGVVLGASFLSILGLPIDLMGPISGFYRLLDMAFTTINVEGDVVANLMIAKSVGEYDGAAQKIPLMKQGAMVVDLVGVKTRLTALIGPLARQCGVRYVGGHPMAGLARAGYERSFADLYKGASMILVPTAATGEGDIEKLELFFRGLGFGMVKICSAETHDRMIAHTSQLAHVVSNSYVKSPVSSGYNGFSGGSYKDMTRIACLNEKVWKELFIWNREALLPEIDGLLDNIGMLRDAIASGDEETLEALLRRGREAKESIDAVNPDQPSD